MTQPPVVSTYTCNVVMSIFLLTVWEMVSECLSVSCGGLESGQRSWKGAWWPLSGQFMDLAIWHIWGWGRPGQPQLHFNKSQTYPLPEDFFPKPNNTATVGESPGQSNRLRNSGPHQVPMWVPLSGKKWERRDKMFWLYLGFNFSLGRKFSLADGKDLILLNYAEHCRSFVITWYTLWNPICRAAF